MSKITLKPCPFCGGSGEFRFKQMPRKTVQQKVVCMVCEAQSPHGLIIQISDLGDEKAIVQAEAIATDRWNTRHHIVDDRKLVDMLAPQWRVIENSRPDWEAVLLYDSGRFVVGCTAEWDITRWVDVIHGDDLHIDPTHWMPLPDAPIKAQQIDSEKERVAKKIAEDSGMISRSTSP